MQFSGWKTRCFLGAPPLFVVMFLKFRVQRAILLKKQHRQQLQKGVFKPDQLIKRRGKHGLVHLGGHEELKAAFQKRRGETIQVRVDERGVEMAILGQ